MKKPPPRRIKVSGGKSTQIKAATREELKDNQEFPESYASAFTKGTKDKNELTARKIYAYMDGENRKYRARKNEMQPGVSAKVQMAHNTVGRNSTKRIKTYSTTRQVKK